ncbi:metallophosphoesterase [Candidatus Parcubacteria bacterium]|nr:metallophosphoesterase [Candidatus Parcubacteria bacterium]
MKIAIISDIHDNIPNLKKCLFYCAENDIEKIFCCGDVTNSDTLKFLANNFQKEIYLVRGNMELFEDKEPKKYKNIIYFGRVARFELEGKKIGLCHEPFLLDYVLKKGECDMVFYGHTHKPWIEKKSGYSFVNPGTLSGVFQKATFAVWDLKENEPELKILERM